MPDTAPLTGRCYCGAVAYAASGDPMLKAQCHCRPCQYFSGGGANYFMLLPTQGFVWTKGTPASFARTDLDTPVTRRFCADCGTHLTTEMPDGVRTVLKVGTLDDPSHFDGPRIAIHTADLQPYHLIADGLPTFERLP